MTDHQAKQFALRINALRRIQKFDKVLQDLDAIASAQGTYDYCPYLCGMANGIRCLKAIWCDEPVVYMPRPDHWLEDSRS